MQDLPVLYLGYSQLDWRMGGGGGGGVNAIFFFSHFLLLSNTIFAPNALPFNITR